MTIIDQTTADTLEAQLQAVRVARVARDKAAKAYRISAAEMKECEFRLHLHVQALSGPPAQPGIALADLPPEVEIEVEESASAPAAMRVAS